MIVEQLSFLRSHYVAARYICKKRDYVKATYEIYICDYMILSAVGVIASSVWITFSSGEPQNYLFSGFVSSVI